MQSFYLTRKNDNQMYYQACINAGWNGGQDTFYGPNPQNGVPAWGCYDGCSSNCCVMNQPAIQTPPLFFLALSLVSGGSSTVLNPGASTSEYWWETVIWVVTLRCRRIRISLEILKSLNIVPHLVSHLTQQSTHSPYLDDPASSRWVPIYTATSSPQLSVTSACNLLLTDASSGETLWQVTMNEAERFAKDR